MKNKKYMILCVAGQSNAVGYDESVVPEGYLKQFQTDRIFQLGLHGEDNLKIIPLGVCAQSYQDMRPFGNDQNQEPDLGTRGIHLPLANLLLSYIPEEYEILVVSCAYGGTGFTSGEYGSYDPKEMRPEPGIFRWGVKSPYYQGMKDRIGYLLDLNPENKFLGVVWIQGEQDAQDADGHKEGYLEMTEDFLSDMKKRYAKRVAYGDWDRDIWFNVETVAYWYQQGACDRIWKNYREWNENTYVEIPRSTDSNEKNGTGKTAAVKAVHYGNNAFADVVAPRTFERMRSVWETK